MKIKCPKKLIEVALPLDEINAEAARRRTASISCMLWLMMGCITLSSGRMKTILAKVASSMDAGRSNRNSEVETADVVDIFHDGFESVLEVPRARYPSGVGGK